MYDIPLLFFALVHSFTSNYKTAAFAVMTNRARYEYAIQQHNSWLPQ
jgi:hypothetical protein